MTRIMVIAGTDSSGGAGLTRDATVAQSLGVTILPVVTAVTAQSDHAMISALPMPPGLVTDQITAGCASGAPAAIKIGMLASVEIAESIAQSLAGLTVPVVLDPVLKSSSGGILFPGRLTPALMRQVTLLTPNLPEAAALTGQPLATTDEEIATQAEALMAQGARAVLIKGGHGQGVNSEDHLFQRNDHERLVSPRLRIGRRGTGCTLATAIACYLARGDDLATACARAKRFVFDWLECSVSDPTVG